MYLVRLPCSRTFGWCHGSWFAGLNPGSHRATPTSGPDGPDEGRLRGSLRRLEGWRDKWTISLLLSLVLLGGLVATWIGLLNLGVLVISGITRTLLFGLALISDQFFSDLFDGLDEGRYR